MATVLSVLIVDHNTILTERQLRPSYSGKPDVEVRSVVAGGVRLGVPASLVRDPGLKSILPVFSSRIRVHTGAGKPSDIEIIAVDPEARNQYDAYHVLDGSDFSHAGASEVLVSEYMAERLGTGLGEVVELQRALPAVTRCEDGKMVEVRGVAIHGEPEAFTVAGILEGDDLGRRRAVIIPFKTGARMFGDAPVQPVFWARLTEGAVFQDVRERLKDNYVVDKPKGALVGERIDQRAFRKSVRISAFLSLLLGLFVIYNAFSLSLVERVREIGLLRAMGFSSGEITYSVLLEGLVLSSLGAIMGLLLSFVIVSGMSWMGITTLGFGKPLVIQDIPLEIVGFVLMAGVAAAMLGMIAPLFRVRNLSVIEAVRAGQIAYRPDPTRFIRALILVLLPALLLVLYMVVAPPLGDRQEDVFRLVAEVALWVTVTFGLVLLAPRVLQGAVGLVLRGLLSLAPRQRPIALAAVRGAHHRIFGSTVGIALVLAAVISIHGITASLKDESARFSERTLTGRVFVQTEPVKKERVKVAAEMAAVGDFYSLSAEVHSPFPIRGVQPDAAVRWVPDLTRDDVLAAEFRDGRSIVLSEFLARSHGYSIGDEVRLSTHAGAYPVRVSVISDAFGYFPDDRNFAVMAMPTFEALFCVSDEVGTQYVLHVSEDDDAGGVRDAMVQRLASQEVIRSRTASDIKAYYQADMNRDFWIFDMILALTALLAVVGLWNSLTVALLERRREMALLRTVGFTPGQLGGMLAAESIALGLVGGALALAAGFPISADLVEAIRIISRLDVQSAMGLGEVLMVPLIAVGIALVATVPPALRLKSLVVASATRME